MNDTVWIVGKTVCGGQWEVKGVFTDELQAIAACTDETCFVGPIVVDIVLPDETQEWPGGYYPRLQEKPTQVDGNARKDQRTIVMPRYILVKPTEEVEARKLLEAFREEAQSAAKLKRRGA